MKNSTKLSFINSGIFVTVISMYFGITALTRFTDVEVVFLIVFLILIAISIFFKQKIKYMEFGAVLELSLLSVLSSMICLGLYLLIPAMSETLGFISVGILLLCMLMLIVFILLFLLKASEDTVEIITKGGETSLEETKVFVFQSTLPVLVIFTIFADIEGWETSSVISLIVMGIFFPFVFGFLLKPKKKLKSYWDWFLTYHPLEI